MAGLVIKACETLLPVDNGQVRRLAGVGMELPFGAVGVST